MTHFEYLVKALTYNYQENAQYGKQCVAMNKRYADLVQWVKLGSFNWEADRATYKKWWTYDPSKRIQLKVGKDALIVGDHIIQKFSTTWHIGVVHRADANGYYLLAQNDWEYHKDTRGNGDGLGNNAIMIRYFKRSDRPILMAFRKR